MVLVAGLTRCWVLRAHTHVVRVPAVFGLLVSLGVVRWGVGGIRGWWGCGSAWVGSLWFQASAVLTGGWGWLGWSGSYVENCTVDASIFVALSF